MVVGWVWGWSGHAEGFGNVRGDFVADTVKLDEDVLFDDVGGQMGGFEADGVNEKLLLGWVEGIVEEARLGPDVGERRRDCSLESAGSGAVGCSEKTSAIRLVGLSGVAIAYCVGRVGIDVQRNVVLTGSIAIVVVDGDMRSIDRKLLEVWSSMAIDLGIEIGEQATLEERVFREINTSDHMPWLKLSKAIG